MKTSYLIVAFLWAGPVAAQVDVQIRLPSISFEAPPPLVVVEPGVQVVMDYDEEVFFVNNWYWVRRDGRWYRTHNYRGGWVVVDAPAVPVRLVRLPHGHYRHYHGKHWVEPPHPASRVVVAPPRPRVRLPPPPPVFVPAPRVPLPPAPPVFVPAPPPGDDRDRDQGGRKKHGKGKKGKD